METSTATAKLLGKVTDATSSTLEYGDYRGWVLIDANTGGWEANVTDEEAATMSEGATSVYSTEYFPLFRLAN